MEKKISFSEILKKYTMVIVLVLVVIMFAVNTKGVMLLPQNVNNLVAQNAYVFILATGMLFCILTGGNIDLSVGSVVCFVAAVGGKMMVLNSMNPYLTMLVMLLTGIAIGAWQGFWIAYESNGSAFVPGDVNGDGQVMTDDALTAMRCALGLINLDASQLRAADMDGDGAVSTADALTILRLAICAR